jgi:hypothetical protein
MERLLKHKLIVIGVALLVAGSAGAAYAATQSGNGPRQAFLGDVAKRLGVPPSQLRSAVQGALLDRLNAAVKAGELTQAQADRIRQRIQQGGALPFGGPGGHGRLEPGGARHSLLPTAATYLGLTDAQLLGDLEGGKSLAQVATAQHKSVSGLEQVLVTAARSRLDRMVASGLITKAQEQRKLSRLHSRIGRLVNHARMARGPEPDRPGPAPSAGAPGVPPPPAA